MPEEMHARLFVQDVSRNAGNFHKVSLRAAGRGEENAKWASATPTANFDLTVNDDARAWFDRHVGRELHVVMTPVPDGG